MRFQVYLSIGSNKGNRLGYIEYACIHLKNVLNDFNVSRIYETAPRYYKHQSKFLNLAASGYYKDSPFSLLREISFIESGAGRKRNPSIPKGPRTLDIDIILFGSEIIKTEQLTIPHEGLKERRFVLIPLLELNPTLYDPVTRRPLWEYLYKLDLQGVYLYNIPENINEY
ncbi:MAG: 2-amino-4-hydroxy-6-hydroxymethyldihydropteridine diphosphokinase [Spirochaetes bacterium]|nr:MAG: 2-amino-4-hydroxy-6-hydroxymethyldihydropteridine diphosphokinase [Spirochaetota bacterium]